MTSGMRWRIVTLQAVLVLVLAFCAGFLYWANNFTTTLVRDQLVAQQIYFPDKGSPSLVEYRRKLAETQIEQVGKRLRALQNREVQEAHGVGAPPE